MTRSWQPAIRVIEAGPVVEPLPVERRAAAIELWGREVGPLAMAAAAGAAAGVAAVAVARASRPQRRVPRRGLFRRRERVVARRSFLVDVHVSGASRRPMSDGLLEVEVRPRFPVRLPRGGGGDGVMRVPRGGAGAPAPRRAGPVRVRAWHGPHRRSGCARSGSSRELAIHFTTRSSARAAARPRQLELAIERMRFALGLEDDMTEFFQALPARPAARAGDPSQALDPAAAPALALGGARLGDHRAADRGLAGLRDPAPHRPPLGPAGGAGRRSDRPLIDVPSPQRDRRPRPGRARLDGPDRGAGAGDGPLRARGRRRARRPHRSRVATAACSRSARSAPGRSSASGCYGRGDPDSLPAGDLAFVKLVGHLAGLGRRATVEEVEEYFAPYAPFRGLAGTFALAGWHKAAAEGGPLRRRAGLARR